MRHATEYLRQAIAIFEQIGNVMSEVGACLNLAVLLDQQGYATEALPYAQRAAQVFAQIGHAEYTQRAQQLVAQLQDDRPAPTTADTGQAAFEAFQRAGSIQEMQAALAAHPMLKAPEFYVAIERVIREQVPDEAKPAFEQRLAWLKQLTRA
jgi:tetratricopeptide (TPR) repeat protein